MAKFNIKDILSWLMFTGGLFFLTEVGNRDAPKNTLITNGMVSLFLITSAGILFFTNKHGACRVVTREQEEEDLELARAYAPRM